MENTISQKDKKHSLDLIFKEDTFFYSFTTNKTGIKRTFEYPYFEPTEPYTISVYSGLGFLVFFAFWLPGLLILFSGDTTLGIPYLSIALILLSIEKYYMKRFITLGDEDIYFLDDQNIFKIKEELERGFLRSINCTQLETKGYINTEMK